MCKCMDCNGTGVITESSWGNGEEINYPCESCNGNGEIEYTDE